MRYILFFVLSYSATLVAQPVEAFRVYTSSGKRTSVEKMFANMAKNEVVLFGEYHDNPIVHWLQLESTIAMSAQFGRELVLSFEMFERDQQELLDKYMSGSVTDKEFKDSCRLWPNYKTDYKPIIEFGRSKGMHAIAANVPRKYANLLFKKGRGAIDSLSAHEKIWMAPSDFPVDSTLSQYAALLDAGAHMGGKGMMEAQAFKDATMAQFILRDRKEGRLILHFNGAYHSDFHQGILWYLKRQDPEIKVLTISTVSQSQVRKLDKENCNRADYIICVDENMTSTH